MVADLHSAMRNSELCGENARETETTLRFDYGRVVISVEGVPAVYCPDLDETLVAGPIGIEVSDLAAHLAKRADEFLAQLESESTKTAEGKIELSQRLKDMIPA